MSLLLSILANQISPIFLTAAAGLALGRALQVDVRAISRTVFYVFSPCLVLVSLAESDLSGGDLGRMALFTVGSVVLFGLAAFLFGRALRLDRQTLAGLVVCNMFVNGGNYGLSLNLFAFGETALAWATIYYAVSTLLVNTAGIAVASSGQAPMKQSLIGIFKVPMVYGLALAVLLRFSGWEMPLPLYRSVKLLAQAAIPVMLLVLGLQFSQVQRPENLRLVTAASVLKLILGPVIGLTLTSLLGLRGPAQQAAVLEASMPTAVIATILAVEYRANPAFVTSVVLVSTLLSPILLTPLIAYLHLL